MQPEAQNDGVRPADGPSLGVSCLIHGITAALLLAAGWLLGGRPELAVHWGWARTPLVGTAAVLALLPVLHRHRRFARFNAQLCLTLVSVVVVIAAAEVGFRLAKFDFRRQEAFLRRIPPYYQKPTVPTGEVFFRRPGPRDWTGQVIRSVVRALGLPTDTYRDEPVVTVHYNRFGFRNDDNLKAWDIAVVGDSFTELGYLPAEELFTTILGRRLNRRVLNLGVASTGPFTYLSYLQDYGLCPEVRETLVVFNEGNDMEDLRREQADGQRFQRTGQRPRREVHPQTSLLRAVGELSRRTALPAPQLPVDAWFQSAHGRIAVTLQPPPRSRADQPAEALQALATFADRYVAFARQHNVRPWLAYMPCKQRICHGRLEFSAAAADNIKTWRPNDLPAVVAAECDRTGIGFIDLTPALREATDRTGELLFNTIYDTHLNAGGSAVVAEALARALAAGPLAR
ncbi:MAG: hypothetical protein ABSC03_09545 [Verrucomicrobiota bacterium]